MCLAIIALLSVVSALTAIYRSEDLGRTPVAALAGLLMLIVLPGLSLGAVVLDSRLARSRRRSRE